MSYTVPESEAAFVLGVLANSGPSRWLRSMDPTAFSEPHWRELWAIMRRVFDEGRTVDVVAVAHYIRDAGLVPHLGDVKEFCQRVSEYDFVKGSALDEYGDNVLEAHARRRLHDVLQSSAQTCEAKPSGEVAANVIDEIRRISPPRTDVLEAWKVVDELGAESKEYLQTGVDMLDDLTGYGIPMGEPTLIGGVTGGGKSLLASQICANLASEGKASLIWSLELDRHKMMWRVMQQLSGNKKRDYDPVAWDKAQDALCRAGTLILDDSRAMDTVTIEKMLSTVESVHESKPLSVVVIDYVQLVTSERNFREEWQEQEYIGKLVRQFSKASGIPILCLAQIDFDSRGEPFTTTSKKWKNHAGIFASLIRNYDKQKNEKRYLWVTKNRHGEGGVHYPIRIHRARIERIYEE